MFESDCSGARKAHAENDISMQRSIVTELIHQFIDGMDAGIHENC